jgi:hypothetical protein
VEVWVENLWLEVELGDGWRAAYRLVPYRKQPVVAELRIFPADVYADREAGTWRAEVLGVMSGGSRKRTDRLGGKPVALPAVRDGLKRRFVQARVRMGEHLRLAGKGLDDLIKAGADDLIDTGFADPSESASAVNKARRPPRRGSRPDRFYAEVARAYVRHLNAGSKRPTSDIARERRLSQTQARDAVRTAREKGFLTPGRRGSLGGTLTELAKQLLNERSR